MRREVPEEEDERLSLQPLLQLGAEGAEGWRIRRIERALSDVGADVAAAEDLREHRHRLVEGGEVVELRHYRTGSITTGIPAALYSCTFFLSRGTKVPFLLVRAAS